MLGLFESGTTNDEEEDEQQAPVIRFDFFGKQIYSPLVPVPSKLGKIEMYSPAFYAAYTANNILNYGLTHVVVTPLDLVKCNMQVRFF